MSMKVLLKMAPPAKRQQNRGGMFPSEQQIRTRSSSESHSQTHAWLAIKLENIQLGVTRDRTPSFKRSSLRKQRTFLSGSLYCSPEWFNSLDVQLNNTMGTIAGVILISPHARNRSQCWITDHHHTYGVKALSLGDIKKFWIIEAYQYTKMLIASNTIASNLESLLLKQEQLS